MADADKTMHAIRRNGQKDEWLHCRRVIYIVSESQQLADGQDTRSWSVGITGRWTGVHQGPAEEF